MDYEAFGPLLAVCTRSVVTACLTILLSCIVLSLLYVPKCFFKNSQSGNCNVTPHGFLTATTTLVGQHCSRNLGLATQSLYIKQ